MIIENDILIIGEEISNLRPLTKLLEKEGYQIRPAAKAQTAIDSALAKPPGLILLDVRMPDMDGFELCRRLKRDKRTRDVPVIFISALKGIEAIVEGPYSRKKTFAIAQYSAKSGTTDRRAHG